MLQCCRTIDPGDPNACLFRGRVKPGSDAKTKN